jgi:hypothetical protein
LQEEFEFVFTMLTGTFYMDSNNLHVMCCADEKSSIWWKILKGILIVLLVILLLFGIIYCCFHLLGRSRSLRDIRWWPFGRRGSEYEPVNPDPSPLAGTEDQSA